MTPSLQVVFPFSFDGGGGGEGDGVGALCRKCLLKSDKSPEAAARHLLSRCNIWHSDVFQCDAAIVCEYVLVGLAITVTCLLL